MQFFTLFIPQFFSLQELFRSVAAGVDLRSMRRHRSQTGFLVTKNHGQRLLPAKRFPAVRRAHRESHGATQMVREVKSSQGVSGRRNGSR